jgi:hypothetical protein
MFHFLMNDSAHSPAQGDGWMMVSVPGKSVCSGEVETSPTSSTGPNTVAARCCALLLCSHPAHNPPKNLGPAASGATHCPP